MAPGPVTSVTSAQSRVGRGESHGTGTITGVVVAGESGTGLGYSIVSVASRDGRLTNERGEFTLRDVRAGTVGLLVRHLGYAPLRISRTVRGGIVDTAAATRPIVRRRCESISSPHRG
jgi:hypothetical protein